MCLFSAWMILTDSPMLHPMQLLTSGGQLYGVLVYYTTNLFDFYYKGVTYSRPEALYFWGYFVGLNACWVVVPVGELDIATMTANQRLPVDGRQCASIIARNIFAMPLSD